MCFALTAFCGILADAFMIIFDLRCSQGHVFESWFPDSAAFTKQAKARKLACPLCGDTRVERAPMAPHVSTGKARSQSEKEYTHRAMKALTNVQMFLDQHCDHVGDGFAEEARKIHHGDVEKRNIWGEATLEDAAELREEGVEFGQIPFPARRKDA